MKRRAAAALLAFFTAMACFGMLSSAVAETATALVATERISTQLFDRTADAGDATDGESVISGNGADGAPDGVVEHRACVPSQAVHREGAQAFVYVVAEQSGFLGAELVVRKVGVTVLDENDGYAALAEGAISSEQDVVTRSSRVVADGDKVRISDV